MSESKVSKDKGTTLVAIDDGYAVTKLVLADGTKLKIPSLVRAGVMALSGSSKDYPVYNTITEDGPADFTVTSSSDGDAKTTEFDGYPNSPENRVMVHHALIEAGMSAKEVTLATSLPVNAFFGESSVNTAAIERKNKSMQQEVTSLGGTPCAIVKSAKVFSEGVSAWIDYAIDEKGSARIKLTEPAVVVDIGGRTTDTAKIMMGMTVEKSKSGTINMGVLDLINALRSKIARHKDVVDYYGETSENKISRLMAQEVIDTGFLKRKNLNVDMREILEIERRKVAREIFADVERRVGKGLGIQELLFVGGGSIVFEKEIRERFKAAGFVPDPEFANARGMLKFLQFSQG